MDIYYGTNGRLVVSIQNNDMDFFEFFQHLATGTWIFTMARTEGWSLASKITIWSFSTFFEFFQHLATGTWIFTMARTEGWSLASKITIWIFSNFFNI